MDTSIAPFPPFREMAEMADATRPRSRNCSPEDHSHIGMSDMEFFGSDDHTSIEKRDEHTRFKDILPDYGAVCHRLLPLGPTKRIIGIFQRLRIENDVCISAGAML